MNPSLAAIWREEALAAGFVRVGFARAGPPAHFEDFRRWIAEGRHAGMDYLARTADLRGNPEGLLPGARSVVCLAARHETRPVAAADGSRLARYAAGPDYHWSLRQKAERVAQAAARRMDQPIRYRICVDSTPVAERAFAAAAGLGWIGKNGCLIDPELGSFLLLAEILTDADLPPDNPIAERCGTCSRCLEACPTQAFAAAGVVDARRCIADWTIEHRGPLPDAIKAQIGPHVFGCDVCQEVCPFNAPLATAEPADVPTRAQWLQTGGGQWRRRWGATALNRAGRRGLQRNAAASAGGAGDAACGRLLARHAQGGDAGLADAAAWALRRLPVHRRQEDRGPASQ